MKEKGYLEYKIKELKSYIELAERSFDEVVNREERNYDAIIQSALKVKAFQGELKGMEAALDIMISCEEEEN